jgi:MFS family permease
LKHQKELNLKKLHQKETLQYTPAYSPFSLRENLLSMGIVLFGYIGSVIIFIYWNPSFIFGLLLFPSLISYPFLFIQDKIIRNRSKSLYPSPEIMKNAWKNFLVPLIVFFLPIIIYIVIFNLAGKYTYSETIPFWQTSSLWYALLIGVPIGSGLIFQKMGCKSKIWPYTLSTFVGTFILLLFHQQIMIVLLPNIHPIEVIFIVSIGFALVLSIIAKILSSLEIIWRNSIIGLFFIIFGGIWYLIGIIRVY